MNKLHYDFNFIAIFVVLIVVVILLFIIAFVSYPEIRERGIKIRELTKQIEELKKEAKPKEWEIPLPVVINLIACESSGKHNVWGDNGKSYGILQFQEATFKEMKIKANLPRLQWKHPIHQLILFDWMVKNGYGNRWTCFRNLTTMD